MVKFSNIFQNTHQGLSHDTLSTLARADVPKSGVIVTPLQDAVFRLTMEEWNSILPAPRKSGGHAFSGNWTDILSKKLKESNPSCSFTFKYNRIKADPVKRSGPYFLGKAICKCSVQATITIPHGKENDRKFCVTYDGDSRHSLDSELSRPISSKKRDELKSKLVNVKPSTFFHQSLNAMSPQSFLAGNQDDFGTLPALRKMRSEARNPPASSSVTGSNSKLMQLAEKMRKSDMEDARSISASHFSRRSLFGFIQEIHIEPMRLLLWNEAGIRLWHDLCGTQRTFWDATGSLVKKSPGQERRILNYFLLVEHPVTSEPPLMVAEMISNDHSMSSLQYFLSRFRYSEAQIFGHRNVSLPKVMESDFSLVFVLAALKEFNGETLFDFLERSWRIVTNKRSQKDLKMIAVHVCTSHFMRRLYVRVRKFATNKHQVAFIMHALAVCVNASSLSELSEYVEALMIVLSNEHLHQEVQAAYQLLKEGINTLEKPAKGSRSTSEIPVQEGEELRSKNVKLEEENDEEKALRRSPNSPFACHFQEIWKKKSQNACQQACETNPLFLPSLCKMLLDEYLPTAPLWSGILLSFYLLSSDTGGRKEAITRLTSGKMENSIKALKEEDFNGEKRLPLHVYARKRYEMTLGRQRLFFKGVMQAERKGSKSKPTKGQERFLACVKV